MKLFNRFLRRTSVFLTVGILFVCGAVFNGCSTDKDVNPTREVSVNLPLLYGDEVPVAPPPQPQAAANEKENFHVYLAFGQSNMEGQNWNNGSLAWGSDVLPVSYKQNVNKRFRVMAAVSGNHKLASGTEQRTQGSWYTAVPPLVRNTLGLSPADYFGRTLVAGIADTNIKIGVIAVAVAGAAIEGLEKGSGANSYYNSQQDFMKSIATLYDNNPYHRLVTLAKKAQETGVIKGIIMHQGESGAVSGNWAQKVNGIYDNLLEDLGLPPNSIPFIAGEPLITADKPNQNNATLIRGLTRTMTAKLPNGQNVAHVVSSAGCTSGGDNLHFSYEGYKKLGEEYGKKMLELNYSNQGPTSIAPAKR
ncbi:MAG: sialate O-acetylesterase [Chitinispirillales bacterium]|jgi:hypothetical protein|nr:sialate O-acetylesterase [Chitinispirillales bacterium]